MKNKRVLNIILIIIAIILLVFLIYFIRNFVIINNLSKAQESNNYSYIAEMQGGVIEYAYKDGKSIETLKVDGVVGTITWMDSNTKEKIIIYPEQERAEVSSYDEINIDSAVSTILNSVLSEEAGELSKALTTHISAEKIDGMECYKLQPLTGVISNTYYFNKENNTLIKCIMGENEINFKNWKINELSDEDVSKPDLANYELINNE